MIKVCVCDDDVTIVNRISSVIDIISKKNNITSKVEIFYDGATLLNNLENNNSYYDVIFLDIEMNNMDGIETAKRLRLRDELAHIIYVTSHENYAKDVFSVRPYQFVLKPFKDEIIEKYFLDVYEEIINNDEAFEFKHKGTYYKVLLKNVKYFESKNRSIEVYMTDGTIYEFYDRLDSVEKYLSNSKMDFLRIHKSILVNSRYIAIKRYDHVELTNGEKLKISQTKRGEINEYYMRKVEEVMRNGIDN
ncbi:MAG: response regulator transcription factor [Lachnospiraceae bacterium]|nr:response regulator transcription factor [Lachnospiraceae bacterium]